MDAKHSDLFKRPAPSYGVASLFTPVGIFVLYALIPSPSDSNWGYGGAFLFILIGFLLILGGVISALVGIFRGEKPIILAMIGLVLNGLPILWLLSGKPK